MLPGRCEFSEYDGKGTHVHIHVSRSHVRCVPKVGGAPNHGSVDAMTPLLNIEGLVRFYFLKRFSSQKYDQNMFFKDNFKNQENQFLKVEKSCSFMHAYILHKLIKF